MNKLSKEELEELVYLQHYFVKNNPDWRLGQCLFNALCAYDGNIAQEVRGSSVDPFYHDERIQDCLDFISE